MQASTSPGIGSSAVVGVALALPLAVYAAIGAFSRYTADDFCWAGTLRVEGFVNAQVFYYTVYSPRYAFTFLVNLVELAGPAVVPALPAAAILVWLAVLTWTFSQFGLHKLRAFVLAELAAFAVLQTAPDLSQSLYWQTGMLTYLLPLVLATFLIGWIRRGRSEWWAVGISGLVTFVGGGLSETYLIPQNVALTLALAAALVLAPRDTGRLAHLAAALAGGVLALVVIVIAPATAGRVGGTPADLWLALSAAIATGAFQVVRLARYFAPTMLLCLAVPALVGSCAPRIERRWFVIVTAVVAVTLPFCYFPSFYAQNGNPPARSLIVPGAILIGYLIFVGIAVRGAASVSAEPVADASLADVSAADATAAGATADGARRSPGFGRVRLAYVLAVALGLVPVVAAALSVPQVASAAQYAALFDAEDQQIRTSRDAGQTDLTAGPLPPNFGEEFITADRQHWFNICVARYYGVRSIAIPS
jgi:Family of unknown function (DUF6056)